jgi:cytoskeleton protein RodZ
LKKDLLMTETVESAFCAPEVQQSNTAGFTLAGEMLKKAREEAGLHIGALAVSLKVPVSKLEALEAGHLEQLSGLVFVRALASSVCRTLKVDPTAILAALPQAITAQLHQKGDLNEPFRGEGRGMHFFARDKLLKPSIGVVAVLLIGAALLMFLPNMHLPVPFGEKEVALEVMPLTSAVMAPVLPEPVVSSVSSNTHTATVALASVPTDPVLASTVSSIALSPEGGPASGAPVAALGSDHGVLAFKASATSWVEVTNAKGVVVFRKMLTAGETAQVDAVLPLKTVVGRADATEVSVRGVVVDLKSVSKENVARFEVK